MSRAVAILLLAASAAPAAQQAPPPGTRQVRLNVSPAGQAVLKKYLGAPDPAVAPQMAQLRDVAQQMVALTNGPKLDLVRLQALLRRQEAIEASVKHHNNDRTVQMLGEMSEADRLSFVRSLRAAGAAAQPPAHP
ncbi:MAG: hypothetical protein JO157_08440 [Acetobacteraceae bacterium]|nr:hypothetical protein [Acetobacteraceae bacterium]